MDTRRVVQELQRLVHVNDEPVQHHQNVKHDFPDGLEDFEVSSFTKSYFEGDQPEIKNRWKENNVHQTKDLD